MDDTVVNWLLESENPSIKYLTLTELLGEPPESKEAQKIKMEIPKSSMILSLFSGQQSNGSFNCNVYDKWMGAHWRLPLLVDLAIPEGDTRAIKAAVTVLDWLHSEKHKKFILSINGLTRRCGSQEGNALGVCCRLGMAKNPRVEYLAESLISWQWPDGGWNCDRDASACHSSFHESVIPAWGLLEYHRATGDNEALAAATRTGEFILRHRLFRSEKTGEIIHPSWLCLRYPHYWHYDILQGLSVISMLGMLGDSRTAEALNIIEQKRQSDGRWKANGYHWKYLRTKKRYSSPVDWWRGKPNKMITLKALKILKAAGRTIE
jgi:hypothetical protein